MGHHNKKIRKHKFTKRLILWNIQHGKFTNMDSFNFSSLSSFWINTNCISIQTLAMKMVCARKYFSNFIFLSVTCLINPCTPRIWCCKSSVTSVLVFDCISTYTIVYCNVHSYTNMGKKLIQVNQIKIVQEALSKSQLL